MTEQPSDHCYPQIFLISFSKSIKSGDKGERSASTGFFCPLRSRVKG